MNEVVTGSPYYIFMNGGDKMYILGKTGQYEEELSKGMAFSDKMDAIIYVEKHGYQKIATIRKVGKRVG